MIQLDMLIRGGSSSLKALSVAAMLVVGLSHAPLAQETLHPNYQRNNAIYLAYDHLCRTGEFERVYEGDGRYDELHYQRLMAEGSFRRRDMTCLAFTMMYLPPLRASLFAHELYPGFPDGRPTLDHATVILMSLYLWAKWVGEEDLCQPESAEERATVSVLHDHIYAPYFEELVAHDYQVLGDTFTGIAIGRGFDHASITRRSPELAGYCLAGMSYLVEVTEVQLWQSGRVDGAAVLAEIQRRMDDPSLNTNESGAASSIAGMAGDVEAIELFDSLEGWWWYGTFGSQWCDDTDGQYLTWIGRASHANGYFYPGGGGRKVVNYDGNCAIDAIFQRDGGLELPSQCIFEGEASERTLAIDVLSSDRVAVWYSDLGAVELGRCPAEE